MQALFSFDDPELVDVVVLDVVALVVVDGEEVVELVTVEVWDGAPPDVLVVVVAVVVVTVLSPSPNEGGGTTGFVPMAISAHP